LFKREKIFANCVNDFFSPKLEVIETLKYKSNLHKKKKTKARQKVAANSTKISQSQRIPLINLFSPFQRTLCKKKKRCQRLTNYNNHPSRLGES